MNLEIIVAENAGFCFGVKRAVEKVYDLIEHRDENTRIFTVGRLIHNQSIIDDLLRRGVNAIEPCEIDKIYAESDGAHKSVVVIRTHGVEREVSAKLEEYAKNNPNFEFCDMTCPYVKKIHKIVSGTDCDEIIIVGDKNHPEVRGICSYAECGVRCIDSADELDGDKPSPKRVLAVAQTTQNLAEWKKCQKKIEKLYTNAIIFDTICKVTELRQSETDELSRTADAMLVVGGRESSNTRKLYDISKKNLSDTFFLQTADDIPNIFPGAYKKVGITAGASTPGGIIQEVINKMSEFETKIKEGEESFADLLEQSLKTLNTGETVSGVVTSISSNELHLDLGTKFTGIIPSSEITDDTSAKLSDLFKVGDTVEAIVVKVSDRDGVATLSKKRVDNIAKWKNILDAFNEGKVIEGKVTEVVKGGVVMNCDGMKVFVPASQTGIPKDGDMNTLLGKVKQAKIIDVNEGRKRAVASIRVAERELRREREEEVWNTIEIGKEYEGEVKSLTSYGAFVDLGGVDGMVHSSELSWKRIKHPSEVVSVGDVIKVFVKDFDREARRISLGYKTEATNPWNIFTEKYSVGDVADVKIVSLMPFGAFAEVVPGVDGLIHISRITDHKIAKPDEVLSVGQTVQAKITDIDNENHKISLSMRDLLEDAEEEASEEN